MFMDRKIQYCQDVSSSRLDLDIQCHPSQLFCRYQQTESKIYMEKQLPRRANTTLNKKKGGGASLVAQWLRICLLMQETRVRALVWEDPTCRGAAGPVSHGC